MTRSCLRRLGATTAALVLMPAAVHAVDFQGQNVGAIPDLNPAGRTITFDVSGLEGSITTLRLTLGINHTYIADLDARLLSPGGVAELVVFSRAGRGRTSLSGIGANLSGTYVFSDLGSGDLWGYIDGATSASVIPAGSYRTTTGGRTISNVGGCSTHLNRAFGGLVGAQVNGQWTFNVADLAGSDIGAVTGATLSIETDDTLVKSSFEDGELGSFDEPPPVSAVRGRCKLTLGDFTGTGLTSYATVRNTGGGPSGAVTWYVKGNDATTTQPIEAIPLGISTDFFVDGDYDGDGIRDIGIWRAGAQGVFLVRRSSRPDDAPLSIVLGRSGDDPNVAGDFDGDNVTDAAVYRAGAAANDPSFTLIRLSSTGALRTVQNGQNGHFFTGGIDFDGDALADMKGQSNAGGNNAAITIYDGENGVVLTSYQFGAPTDVIVPGNHVGTDRYDTTRIRGSGGQILWQTRDGESGAVTADVALGVSATDFVLSGDYDGDGLDDYAVWQPGAPGRFVVRRSTQPAALPLEVEVGQTGDYPVANARSN